MQPLRYTQVSVKASLIASILLILSTLSSLSHSQNSFTETNVLDLSGLSGSSFLPVKQAYQPDSWFDNGDLVIQWDIADGYYLYKDKTSFSGNSFEYEDAVFEESILIMDEYFGKEMATFRERTEMRLPNFTGSGILTIEAQGCADAGLCYAPTDFWFEIDSSSQSALYSVDMPAALVSAPSVNSSQSTGAGNNGSIDSFFLAIIMAFAGGLILNLMPCVFPVLAIKALKISTVSESFSSRAKEAGAYTAGILTTVMVIAGLMIGLRSGGAQIGWGFQLQSPTVVFALTALFFLIGLSFSGMINFGARFAGVGQSLTEEDKPLKSFFTGVLAMVVASPCSAPFMAAAMGYAISQPAYVSLVVFAALGLGMAAPLILLYMIPAVAASLPRPGAWMETLKELLAFPMYLTCIWLIWVLMAQVGATGAATAMAALCILTMAVWLYGRSDSSRSKVFAAISLVIAIVLSVSAIQQKEGKPTSTAGSQFTLAALDSQTGNNPVFLDVTADWCITCKFNESRVLYTADIQELFAANEVIYLVADWTNENPEITQLLDRHQRVGIPLYLYYPAGKTTPEVLPQVLTKEMIRNLFNS